MDAYFLVAIDDLELADAGIDPALVTDRSERLGFGVRRRDGTAASAFFGGAAEPATWHVVIRPPTAAARDAVLAALGSDPTEERRLRAERADPLRSTMVARAAVTLIETPNELDLVVSFEASDSAWEDEAAVATAKSFATALDRSVAVAVPGNARTAPSLRLRPAAQRAARTAAVGWSWRRRYAVANGGEEPLFRYPVRIDLGDTAALVAGGKAQASGNDLRVWLNGLEQQRTLVGWNSGASACWVVVPVLAVGETAVFDVVYGNPSAGAAPALAYPNAPAFVLGSSTNALWVYDVSTVATTAGRGLWYLSRGTNGNVVDFGVPGAWRPALTLGNPASKDLTGQQRTRPYFASGAWHHVATLFAERRPSNAAPAQPPNGLDGVAFANPFGVVKVRAAFSYVNPWFTGQPWGQFVALARQSGAEPWYAFAAVTQNSDTDNVLEAADYAPGGAVKHVAFAVWPANGVEMPVVEGAEGLGLGISVSTLSGANQTVEVTLAGGLAVTPVTAEEEVYELATELRLGGGAALAPPYRALLVGNARGADGAGTPRCALRLDQTLAIDAATRAHVVEATAAPGVPVEAVPTHAVRAVAAWTDAAGLAVESPATEWLALAPARTPPPNGDFGAGVGGWGMGTGPFAATPLFAVAREWDAAVGGEVAGALRLRVTANAAGAGARAYCFNHKAFAVNGRANAEAAAWVRTSNANLTPRLLIAFHDAAGNLLGTQLEPDWTPTANAEYRRVAGGPTPPGAATFRVGVAVHADAAGALGSVWLDDLTVNGNELIVTDVAMGALDVAVLARGRWL